MLINDFETLKKYVPTIATGDFDLFKPFVESAEESLIENIAGRKIFETASEQNDERLTELCRRYAAFAAYERAIPALDLVQTENGFAVARTADLVPASSERIKALIESMRLEAVEAAETLRNFLDKSEKYGKTYKRSEAYLRTTDTVIRSYTEFKRYAAKTPDNEKFYPKSVREFDALKGALRAASLREIVPRVSENLYRRIIDGLRKNNLSEAEKKLCEHMRFALACFVLGHPEAGEIYVRSAAARLKASPEDFPLWRDSPQGVATLNPAVYDDSGSIFYFMS